MSPTSEKLEKIIMHATDQRTCKLNQCICSVYKQTGGALIHVLTLRMKRQRSEALIKKVTLISLNRNNDSYWWRVRVRVRVNPTYFLSSAHVVPTFHITCFSSASPSSFTFKCTHHAQGIPPIFVPFFSFSHFIFISLTFRLFFTICLLPLPLLSDLIPGCGFIALVFDSSLV